MKCPFCGNESSKVVDSRSCDGGEKIRRRRECEKCGQRFTTYEILETTPIVVIKKDKSRQAFDRDKLIKGMLRACEKRPVSLDMIENAVDDIERKLRASGSKEVSSDKIGQMALEKMREIDDVGYIRFASVYRRFTDIQSFIAELDVMKVEGRK